MIHKSGFCIKCILLYFIFIVITTHWHVSFIDLLLSLQKKNLPWNNCTAMTAKMKWNNIYTINIFMTFFNEFTTQSNTAFSLGTRLIVFSGRNTLNTRSDLMVDKLVPTEPPLYKITNIIIKQIYPCHNKHFIWILSPFLKYKRCECTNHDNCIHYIPKFS